MTAVAVLSAAVCVWLLVPSPGRGLARLNTKTEHRRRRVIGRWPGILIANILLGILAVFSPLAAVLGAAAMVGSTVAWVLGVRSARRRAHKRAQEVVRVAQVAESLLCLGYVPDSAMALVAKECPMMEPVAAALRMGGEPWPVMEQMAGVAGQEGLAEMGRAWRVAHATGASMHESLERVRKNLEEAADTTTIVEGELAGPRATGQMLALLPIGGLAMAYAIGTNPLDFLTSSALGRICLIVGVGLGCIGVVWSEAVSRRAAGNGREV